MRKHTLLATLVLLVLALVTSTASAQTFVAKPYIGATISASSNMNVPNPGDAAQGGAYLLYGRFVSLHQFQFDINDNTVGGSGTAFTYDGNLLFAPNACGLHYGVGIRTTIADTPGLARVVTRPYLAVAGVADEAVMTLKFILPGNDGWHDQFGLLSQNDFAFLPVKNLTLYLTAGAFSYHATPAAMMPVFESHGVTKYVYVDSPRKLGATVGIGVKYWLK